MIKAMLFAAPSTGEFHGYQIDTFDPVHYFEHDDRAAWGEFIAGGINAYLKKRSLLLAEGIDKLYRQKDPSYMKMLAEFVDRFRDHDLIVMLHYNFVHPEVLYHELKKPVKILGFYDDPPSTYVRGIPYLWAFDGAIYGSPSYSATSYFDEALQRWGCERSYWHPFTPIVPTVPKCKDESFFAQRDIDLIYVGMRYTSKVKRLAILKRHFGARMHVYGRWPLGGRDGFIRWLWGKPAFPWKVRSLSADERMARYVRAKIGINMHFSETPTETGNMRMYEVPLHGVMLLCDKAGREAHEKIYTPDKEAIFYDSIEDAIEKAEYYLENDAERIEIARNGFNRARRDYEWENNLLRMFDWAMTLRARKDQ